MKFKRATIKDFKRFTDLTVEGIPETARLIMLAGPHGCASHPSLMRCIFGVNQGHLEKKRILNAKSDRPQDNLKLISGNIYMLHAKNFLNSLNAEIQKKPSYAIHLPRSSNPRRRRP